MSLIANPKRLCSRRPNSKQRSTKQSTNHLWNASTLEERVMLDGAGLVPSVAQAPAIPAQIDAAFFAVHADRAPAELVFVDANVDDFETIAAGISESAKLILLDSNVGVLEQITHELQNHPSVRSVHVISHGNQGRLEFASETLNISSLNAHRELLATWKKSLTDDADILLYGCHVSQGMLGQQFIERFAELTGADLAASTNLTGAVTSGADWILESAVGKIDSGIALSQHAQTSFRDTLASTIQVIAAGTTGEENIDLLIDGQTVATYSNLGSGAYNGQFQTMTFSSSADVTADDVRIQFTNDLYDPVNSIDRNVGIDAIVINGIRFETEDESVFSTGTWLPEDGIQPGFGRGDFLNTDGYFQYASRDNDGSVIQMRVRGSEGTEQFNLRVNGEIVGFYDASTDWQTLTYTHDDIVFADDIRIELENSQYDPVAGIDQNLFVDSIAVDGQVFESEDASVYSTGTWTPTDGIVPGFGRGDILHGDGYLQFAGSDPVNNGSRILMDVRGSEGNERFNLIIDGQVVKTFTAATTGEFSTFAYTHDATVTPSDVRIEFINDQWDPVAGIDANLSVNFISIDGKAYQTESPAVFSTGTWKLDDGVVAGYRESETLHVQGYFQFADSHNYLVDFDAEGDGQWSDVEPLGLIPIHSMVLPDGKVFSFGTDSLGMQGGQFIYSLYDPETGVERVLPNTTDTDVFCSNMSLDPLTGNVLITGGDKRGEGGPVNQPINDVLVFDYATLTLRDATQGEMRYARWYGSSITLPNGEIMVMGGTGGGKDIPEVFNAQTGWRTLTGVDVSVNYYYPKTFVASDGSVIVFSGGGNIYKLNTAGTGSSQQIGNVSVPHQTSSPAVMYDVDKVAVLGTDSKIYTIDLSAANPTFTLAADTLAWRRDGGMSVLPDGRVLLTGGSSQFNVLSTQVNTTEIWDPATNEVTQVGSLELGRLYHSTHILLPSGTVWAGGGGAPGPLTNLNVEFYAPDYLYGPDGTLADRPVIADAPSNVGNSSTFQISVEDADALDRITAVRSGALTHAVNSDTRFLELSFQVINDTTVEVTTLDPNIMVPGTWMLFALDNNGVPSEAAMLGLGMVDVIDTPHFLA